MAGLKLSIAEKRFAGSGEALFSGLDLLLAEGSTTALLGPSGVGKSTLLRIIAGIDRGFRGEVRIDGQAIERIRPGMVFQDARLLPWLRATDNLRAVNPNLSKEVARAWLERVDLGAASNLFPRQLSGGMQRRVALARALAMESPLLVLDEPFVSLDQALAEAMTTLVFRQKPEPAPIIVFSTHTALEAARHADRILALAGRPARISLDLALPVPTDHRTETDIDAVLRRLSGLHVGQA